MSRLDWYIRANLKFRHLQLLVAIDDLRHVGRVAAYLNVTQPAVSKTLLQLEQRLNVALFERTRRGMEPTVHGECLIRHAREIIACLVDARDELLDISEGRITRVVIGVLPTTAIELVPRFIARLEAESSDVAAGVIEGTMSTLLPTLRAGDIDLVVGLLSEQSLEPEFATELLYEDPIVVAVRPEHPLATVQNLKWPSLSGYPLVLPPTSALTRNAIDTYIADHGVLTPRRRLDSVSTLTNIGVLRFTDSVGFISRGLAQHYAAQGFLRVLPLELPTVKIRAGLVWVAGRHLGVAQRLVCQLLRETARQLPSVVADARTKKHPRVANARAGVNGENG
ncbi:MAG: LysR family transcriptional regulator [Rhodocyclaceae bacterium]|nr:MAG: LysR family transcriptional regulator [Rhodocyclaceae bacterium]